MHIFLCAGEPSGDLHGANLIRELRGLHPPIECEGFGGERMQAAGCRLLYPLCRLAVMGFVRVLAHAPTFLDLLSQADRYFRHERPDAVVLIDYPGFNWWLARRAHFHGIPVFYFLPPQLWGWAGWRVKKMRRWVDHVLCCLPFEEEWYRQRGVRAHYVGHPYFDELSRQRLDQTFVAEQRRRTGIIVGLLPGSRNHEVQDNTSMMVRAAERIRSARPDVRFLVACFKHEHGARVNAYLQGRGLPIETHVGRTPEIIHLAHACIAVSGSVGLELLYQGKPTVVIYRIGKAMLRVTHRLMTTQYISLVNLLADKEVFPEFLTDRCRADAIGRHIVDWLGNAAAHERVKQELSDLRGRVARPGACERAARYILDALRVSTPAKCA